MTCKYDVIAVDQKTLKVRMIAEDKTEANADAIERMAVHRRGVDDEFFVVVPHDFYAEGDKWDAS
jgi:hypothetical protein